MRALLLVAAAGLVSTPSAVAEGEASEPALTVPASLSPESMEAFDDQLARLGRYPDWDALLAGLKGPAGDPAVRYARSLVMMLRGAVWQGEQGQAGLEALEAELAARPDHESQVLAAHVLMALGRGQLARDHNPDGLATLERAVEALRKLGHDRGLTRALHALARAKLYASRQPADALPVINELLLVADRAGAKRYTEAATRLYGDWRRQQEEVDDYFGRAEHRVQTFPPSLGIPVDADLVAVRAGVLLMNGDTDDQMLRAAPELVRFDGLFVRKQKLPDDALELRGSTLDAAGLLWLATNRGLYTYDGRRFTQLVNPDLPDEDGNDLARSLEAAGSAPGRVAAPLRSNIINEVKQAPDGRMVMATAAGLATFDPSTELWSFVTSEQAPIPKEIERVAPAPDGSLVVAWRHAYAVRLPNGRWQAGRFVFPTVKGEEHGHLYGLLVDRDGHPWVHGLVGALQLEGAKVIRRVDRRFSMMTRNVNHVLHAGDGAWWFATPEGVCRQEGRSCAALDAKRWLPAQWSLDLLEWPAGDVWVSVYQGGLHRLIAPYYRQFGIPDGFMQPINSDLIEMGGKLFFGNANGLTRLDPQTGRIDNFRAGNEGMPRGNFPTDLVLELQTDKLVYTGRGLNRYRDLGVFDGRRSKIYGREAGLPDEELTAACERAPGVVLLAWASGLEEFDAEAGKLRPAEGLAALAGQKVSSLVCAPGEPVWALTQDDALFVEQAGDSHALDLAGLGLDGKPQLILRDPRAGRFVVGERSILRQRAGRWERLAIDPNAFDFRVRDVELDDAGRLYVSTESGVYVTDSETWTLLTSADGLISDTAFDLLWRDGALWVAGHGGATVWRWPPQEAPETWLLVEGQALSVDPDGRQRRLWVSDGVDKADRVVLRSPAGLFELPADRAGPFLPGDKAQPAGAVRDLGVLEHDLQPLTVEQDHLAVDLTAAVPYRDDPPDGLTYFGRLDGGPWQRAEGRKVALADLADGLHRLEVRATDRRLVRDDTPARLDFRVDTPVPAWQIAAAGLLGLLLIFLGRRRIGRAFRRLQHRNYRPIEPSPFCPDRPATGSAFVDRTHALDELSGLVNNGGVAVMWGARGAGKHSLMRRLTERLRAQDILVVELDLATAAAGGDLAAMLQQAAAGLLQRASLRGVDLGSSMGESLVADASQASLDLTPAPPGANPLASEQSTKSGPGSSGSGEGNPFAHFSRLIKRWEASRPETRVALLLDNAEVLSLAMDADAAYGSYFFPFLRSLIQQHSKVAVVLAMEGRWFELAHRFEALFGFATPVALPAFDPQTSAELLTGALAERAWLPDEELAELAALAGGQPYLLQLIGDRLVAGLNASRTNICRPRHVVDVTDALVDDKDGRLKGSWLSLARDEKLVVAALSEAGEAPRPAEQIAAALDAAGGKLLFEEARRALLSLSKDGLVERIGEGFRIRSRLFMLWVQRHHTVASVLEESVETVAHYQLLQKLGAGGMGIVYKARDLVHGRSLAVKLLRAELSESKRSRLRFLREARLGKRLRHSNIVHILDYGEQGGRLYLAMELLEGISLARWIRRNRPVGLQRTVEIGRHICSALAAVHDLGVVHRDVKSDNVMVQPEALAAEGALLPGAVKLMDFGLAVGEDVSRMTKAGTMLGTLAYMAPEQARGAEADRRSDLYSLGVVLFELCAGRPPFVGPETAVLNAVLNEDVPPVTELRPEVPAALSDLIARLLAKDPGERPGYASEVEQALQALEHQLPADGPRAHPPDAAAGPASVASGAMTRALQTDRLLDAAGQSQLRSRSIEVLKLESALLTSLSTAGDSSLSSTPGSSSSRPLEAPEQDGARQLLYWVSAEVARGALDDGRLSDCLNRVAEVVWSTRGLVALVSDGGGALAGRVAIGLQATDLAEVPFFAGLMRRCVDQRMGLTYFGAYEGAGGEGDHDIGSALCAPIWSGDDILGAMLFDRPGDTARPFEDTDLELLVCVGYLLGLGLERERLYRQVLDKERLAAVGNMLAGVAHDMKNPMAVIAGYAELMADIPDVSERQKYGDVIRRQVTEMSEMVANLMAYVRGDRELRPVTTDLAVLADDVRETLGLQCEPKGIELVVDSDGGRVQVDVNRVKRILFNLGRNALEALGEGGRLLIQIRADDGGLALKVRDNGPGIPESIRSTLFAPFVTHGKKGGTGLGLAIVQRFVEDHGGVIDVASQPGKGTTFEVKLPSA